MNAMNQLTRLLIAIFAITCQEARIIPDCYIIQQPTHTECFTYHSTYSNHYNAQIACGQNGGELALIQNERTWELIIEKYLQNVTKDVLLGYTFTDRGELYPPTDLSNMSAYWSEKGFHLGFGCVSASAYSNWTWFMQRCRYSNSPYICQYQVTSCDTRSIEDLNVVIQSCFNGPEVPISQSIEVECVPGCYLNTSSTVTCREGIWDDVQCVQGCPPPGKRNNAQLDDEKEYYQIGEEVSYTCDEGYFSWGDYRKTQFITTCQYDSTWSDENAGCDKREEFSISVIDITTFKDDTMDLECDLNATDKSWLKSGRNVPEFRLWHVTSSGDLIVYMKSGEDVRGFYICTGKVGNRLLISRKLYEVINHNKCQSSRRSSSTATHEIKEGESILLSCPQQCKRDIVKWFKNDEEIFDSRYQTDIPNTGLLLTNIRFKDEGEYKCYTTDKFDSHLYTATHDVSVIPLYENICGTRQKFYRGKQPWYQPWLAVLINNEDDGTIPFCYGTLLNDDWVITSASCLTRLKWNKVRNQVIVKLGRMGKYETFKVETIKIHPKYKKGKGYFENDIGLAKLYRNGKLSSNIIPACISPEDIGNVHKCELVADINGTVAGWGSWLYDDSRNIVDQEQMSLVPKEICRNSARVGFTEDKVCAKFNGKEEKFIGDIGSPFIVNFSDRSFLLGFYSWGQRDSGTGIYDYYTSVSYHYDWIKSVIL